MKLRHAAPVLLLVPLALAGCRKKPPATGPYTSTATTTPGSDGRSLDDSLRADSIARAERDRLEAERRAREAAASSAREALTQIVFFEYDSDEITPTAEELLNAKSLVLRANPGVRIRIEGHCDQRGSTEYNLALGQRRAEAVRAYLVNLGIEGTRLSTISYGKERPLVEGDDDDAYTRNRRAEFSVIGGQVTTVPPELRR
jgi:peptidoglycan-associated lipoprotein